MSVDSTRPAMDARDWQHLNALLKIALDLEPAKRAEWRASLRGEPAHLVDLLNEALGEPAAEGPEARDCATQEPAGRDTVVARLASLRALLADSAAGSLSTFGTTPGALARRAFAGLDRADRQGDLVGPYRLLRPLGDDGMAAIWLAERVDGRLRRKVALKILRPEWIAHAPPDPFRHESVALARLNHPNVVQLHDAGHTADARPYLALEVVQGEPLNRAGRTLALDVRLRLFLQLLRTVAHLHARQVLHRALRLSNVLVTAQGQIKLTGFDVAEVRDTEANPAPPLQAPAAGGEPQTPLPHTHAGLVAGNFRSAADLHALGAVLFELLSGESPFPSSEPCGPMTEDTLPEGPTAAPSACAGDRALARRLRGDLDSIVLKALHQDPRERYATAAAFADDLERYLQNRPVRARRGGPAYRLQRWITRHTSMTVIAVLATAALLAGLLAML